MNQTGILYIVATPIGNIADMTYRAVQVLNEVQLIFAEDTRHSQKLLQYYQITPPMYSLHEHNEREQIANILQQLQAGKHIALISDAGTPLISDPGFPLVQAAKAMGLSVVPIPGACAAITALCASGLASDRFYFAGFLPQKQNQRLQQLEKFKLSDTVTIFYESPHRIVASLHDMLTVFGGERQIVLARELTKQFETIKLLSVKEMLHFVEHDLYQQKGEMVLLLDKAENQQNDEQEALKVLHILLKELSISQACKLAAKLTKLNKNHLYQLALQHQLVDNKGQETI